MSKVFKPVYKTLFSKVLYFQSPILDYIFLAPCSPCFSNFFQFPICLYPHIDIFFQAGSHLRVQGAFAPIIPSCRPQAIDRVADHLGPAPIPFTIHRVACLSFWDQRPHSSQSRSDTAGFKKRPVCGPFFCSQFGSVSPPRYMQLYDVCMAIHFQGIKPLQTTLG